MFNIRHGELLLQQLLQQREDARGLAQTESTRIYQHVPTCVNTGSICEVIQPQILKSLCFPRIKTLFWFWEAQLLSDAEGGAGLFGGTNMNEHKHVEKTGFFFEMLGSFAVQVRRRHWCKMHFWKRMPQNDA